MKLARALLVGAAMAAAVVTAGCKSSSDQGAAPAGSSDPSQPAVQTPASTASPDGNGDDPTARRHRRHRGRGRGHGDWQRKRRAWNNAPGGDDPQPPAPPAQQ